LPDSSTSVCSSPDDPPVQAELVSSRRDIK
jgi:hypothetical protein